MVSINSLKIEWEDTENGKISIGEHRDSSTWVMVEYILENYWVVQSINYFLHS